MTQFGLAALMLILAPQASQTPPEGVPHPKVQAPRPADMRPVTKAEAANVFNEMRRVLSKGLEWQLKATATGGSGQMTREQVVTEFYTDYTALKGDFKFTTPPVSFDASVLKISSSVKQQLKSLIALGCVGKVSPLATGPTDGMTPDELGDAVGLFISRMAQLTHMPDPKWSPALGAGG